MASKFGGAWVLIYSPNKKHVMIAKRSKESNNPNMWNFWGGGVDEGETPKEGAVRELFEESGIVVKKKELVLLGRIRKLSFFGVIRSMKTRPPNIQRAEISKYKWVTVKSLKKMMPKMNPPTKAAIHNKVHLNTYLFKIGKRK